MALNAIIKALLLTLAIAYIPNRVECSSMRTEVHHQCLAKVLPGKTIEEASWDQVKKEAIDNGNRDYQCFILCELTNLNMLKSNGVVQTDESPLHPALGAKLTECANMKVDADSCKNAKDSAQCIINITAELGKYYEVEGIFQKEWKNFDESGKQIVWNN
uniref:CSON002479 protein n=1 Tax=Culicoides sonorensis TaxID=179676 RepID=Q66U39_CULSO|nr:putative secreted salivary protein [Culicoides sonorensis]